MVKTCFVVDDVKFDRIVLERCARKMHFDVSPAASGREALELCRVKLPDCMLIDWEMQGMKGIEVLQQVRAIDGGENVCVIMCTSHEHGSFVGHAYIQGANGFISKPITVDKLEAKLLELDFELPEAPPEAPK